MGVMLVGWVLAAAGAVAPADGHSVVTLPAAKADMELTCPAPLKNAFLAVAPNGKLGLRAPVQPGTVSCTLAPPTGKQIPVTVQFVSPKWPLAVGATRPVILGQDTEAVLEVRGKAVRADGSAGAATLLDDIVRAQLPNSKMPQNLVVLVQDAKGGAAYAVVPLLGRATVKVQTAKDAEVEAVVAGHRSIGFKSDDAGQVSVVVPAPVGFVKGSLDVVAAGKMSHAAIGLPAAKPMYAMAALGPADNVAPNAKVDIVIAGCDPEGLPPKATELKAKPAVGKLVGLSQLQPGLWRLQVLAPPSGDETVELHLGNAVKNVTFHVGKPGAVAAAKPEAKPAEPKPEVAEAKPEPKPEPKPEAKPEPKPEPKPEVAQAKPEPKPEATPEKPEKVEFGDEREARAKHDLETEAEEKPSAEASSGIRLELLLEGGYLTNGGALSGVAPGAQAQVAYRMGDLDVGGGLDALFTTSNQTGQVAVGGTNLATKTTTNSLQLLVGPWARYRFTDLVGVDGSIGAGISRTTEQIDVNGVVNSSGSSSPVAVGALAGLDLNFGLVRAFAGARYVGAKAGGALSGNAGGFAALAGVGVDLGL